MSKKYKVVVKVTAYPSGSLIEFYERFFDTKSEAMKFRDKNNWENPMETSIADAYVYEIRKSWFPIE